MASVDRRGLSFPCWGVDAAAGGQIGPRSGEALGRSGLSPGNACLGSDSAGVLRRCLWGSQGFLTQSTSPPSPSCLILGLLENVAPKLPLRRSQCSLSCTQPHNRLASEEPHNPPQRALQSHSVLVTRGDIPTGRVQANHRSTPYSARGQCPISRSPRLAFARTLAMP